MASMLFSPQAIMKMLPDIVPAPMRLVTHHKPWLRNVYLISKQLLPHSKFSHKIIPITPWWYRKWLWMLLECCPPDPDFTLWVNYPIINGSIDYMELPASFLSFKIHSQFDGHFIPSALQQMGSPREVEIEREEVEKVSPEGGKRKAL